MGQNCSKMTDGKIDSGCVNCTRVCGVDLKHNEMDNFQLISAGDLKDQMSIRRGISSILSHSNTAS